MAQRWGGEVDSSPYTYMFTLINWLLHSIFTTDTNHSEDYNLWLGIMHLIQSGGEFRGWKESLSNSKWADEETLGEVQFMGQAGPCSPLLLNSTPSLTIRRYYTLKITKIYTCTHEHWWKDPWEHINKALIWNNIFLFTFTFYIYHSKNNFIKEHRNKKV